MTSKYQKRHYEDFANILAKIPYKTEREQIIFRDSLICELLDLFKADNPSFDTGRFLEASSSMHVIGRISKKELES